MKPNDWIQDYLDAHIRLLHALPVKEIEAFIDIAREALLNDKELILFGDGGNAASASHFAADMGKGASDALDRRFRVLSLTDNAAWLTAIGNDYAFEDVFVRQLESVAQPGDVLICASVSGNSPNCVKAFEWGNKQGLTSVAITSSRRGQLAELATLPIVLPEDHYGRVEDAQMMIYHLVAYWFMEQEQGA